MARTTALNKIIEVVNLPTFYKVIQGGQAAGKTYAILTMLIGYCESIPNSLVSIVGLSHNHLEHGALRDFKNIMKETNRWNPGQFNITRKTFTFANGSQLEFLSADTMNARGPRRDVLYVNEANGLNFETFEHLANRTKDFVVIDYNPSAKFWAHTELLENPKNKDRSTLLILTYLDNEAIDPQEKANIESKKPAPGEPPSNWWIVYGEGQIGTLEGNIYSGWKKSTEQEIAKNGRLVRYGLDFGFTNDETAVVAVYEMQNGALGLVQKLYKKGILPSDYAENLMSQKINQNVLIIADGARPEIIAEIKKNGFRIISADKSAGSVMRGISRVQEKQIVYAGEDLHKEYLAYAWRKKRSGEIMDEPQDGFDHLMDALRYAVDDLQKPRFDF